jgi:hypothetical protein
MWVKWSVGGVADLAKRNPEPPTGGEVYTVLLCDVIFVFIYFLMFLNGEVLITTRSFPIFTAFPEEADAPVIPKACLGDRIRWSKNFILRKCLI